MKICELYQHCGNCEIIHLCAEPFSELCLCTDNRFNNIDEETYMKLAKKIEVDVSEKELKEALEGCEEDEIAAKLQELINIKIANEVAKEVR